MQQVPEGYKEVKEYCPECFGTGQVPDEVEQDDGTFTRICRTCIGTGWLLKLVEDK